MKKNNLKILSFLLITLLSLSANAQMKYWTMPPYYINFTGANPTATTLPGFSSINYKTPNGIYDINGSLLFSIANANIYYPNGTLLGSIGYTNTNEEISIVPVPGVCKRFYIISNTFYFSQTVLYYSIIDCSSNTYTISNLVTLSTFPGNTAGLAVSKLIGSTNTRYLYNIAIGNVKKYIISSTGITESSIYNISIPNSSTKREVELSNDNTKLVFSNGSGLIEFQLNNLGDIVSTINTSLASPVNAIKGIEIDPNSSKVFLCTNNGLYWKTLGNNSSANLITNSSSYNNSFIEMAFDGKMYVVSNTGILGAINITSNSVSISTITNTIYSNNGDTYLLPDQIDGDGYNFFPTQPPLVTISSFTINSTTLSNTCASLSNINNFAPIQFNATTNIAPTQYKIEIRSLDVNCNPITGTGRINYIGPWVLGAPPANLNLRTLTDAASVNLSTVTGKVRITYFVRNECNIENSFSRNINLLGPPSSMTITGPNCFNNTAYVISTLPSNADVIWSVTPAGIATPIGNGNSCTLMKLGNGVITLTATLGNTIATRVITIGFPFTLYPVNPVSPEAVMETDIESGPCNSQCYSPGGPNIWWNAPIAYNYTSETWQKTYSIPVNYSFWSPGTNKIGLFFKAANQYAEFKRTLTNGCGSTIQYYCFGSTTTLCSGSLRSGTTKVSQVMKVYPNPIPTNRTISLEILSEDKLTRLDFEDATIQLVDANDNIILQKQGNKIQKESLEIPSLSNGTYYIRVINKNGVQTEEIIIRN